MKDIELLLQCEPMTLNSMQERVPDPDMPLEPGMLLMILAVPWIPGGMNPQEEGTLVPEIEPLDTEASWMMSGS